MKNYIFFFSFVYGIFSGNAVTMVTQIKKTSKIKGLRAVKMLPLFNQCNQNR